MTAPLAIACADAISHTRRPMRSLGIDVGGTSVKMALLEDGQVRWTGQSGFYARPGAGEIVVALREAADGRVTGSVDRCGICVPGLLDAGRTKVTLSVNVPGLMELPIAAFVGRAFGEIGAVPRVQNDAISCAADVVVAMNLSGRTLVLAMGTGVGAAVMDDGVPLIVDGESPGHLGQVDVSVGDAAPLGPDNGRGSLEGYVGVPALRRDYGPDVNATLAALTETDPPLRALARIIRIGHALYRPHHVVLGGGIGIRLAPKLEILKRLVDDQLTSVARPERTLQCAANDFHAACGAARLAAR